MKDKRLLHISKICGEASVGACVVGVAVSGFSLFCAEAMAAAAVLSAAAATVIYAFAEAKYRYEKRHRKFIKLIKKPDVEILFIKRIEDVL